MASRTTNLRNLDLVSFCVFLALLMIGWLMIYSVNYDEVAQTNVISFFGTEPGKQLIWIFISIVIFFSVQLVDWKFWQTFALPIYLFSVFLLVLVLFAGSTIKGATSWFSFGGFSFQPSELAKFGTCLAISAYLSSYGVSLKDFEPKLRIITIILIPIILVLLQPDAGSALVFMSFSILLYRAGLSPTYYVVGASFAIFTIAGLAFEINHVLIHILFGALLVILFYQFRKIESRALWGIGILGLYIGYWALTSDGPPTLVEGKESAYLLASKNYNYLLNGILFFTIALVIGGLVWLWLNREKRQVVSFVIAGVLTAGITGFTANYAFNNLLKPHQQERINVWLHPESADPRGAYYNVLQSKMAIGSGGLMGRGFLNGTMTRLNYVPEQTTDFIFCTIGEEQGFVGSFGVIGLILLLLIRLTVIAERQKANFSKYYAYGVAGILFIHFIVNLGMTMGLVPIIGIPLPFISKGGSSLLGFTIMIGVLLKLDRNRFKI